MTSLCEVLLLLMPTKPLLPVYNYLGGLTLRVKTYRGTWITPNSGRTAIH